MPLFLFILYFMTFIQYNHPITFIQYIRRGLSPSPHRLWLSLKDLHVVPSRESNSGLPSSKPTRYQLSHAAPRILIFKRGQLNYLQILSVQNEIAANLQILSVQNEIAARLLKHFKKFSTKKYVHYYYY
jgi:hypothetical protein